MNATKKASTRESTSGKTAVEVAESKGLLFESVIDTEHGFPAETTDGEIVRIKKYPAEFGEDYPDEVTRQRKLAEMRGLAKRPNPGHDADPDDPEADAVSQGDEVIVQVDGSGDEIGESFERSPLKPQLIQPVGTEEANTEARAKEAEKASKAESHPLPKADR